MRTRSNQIRSNHRNKIKSSRTNRPRSRKRSSRKTRPRQGRESSSRPLSSLSLRAFLRRQTPLRHHSPQLHKASPLPARSRSEAKPTRDSNHHRKTRAIRHGRANRSRSWKLPLRHRLRRKNLKPNPRGSQNSRRRTSSRRFSSAVTAASRHRRCAPGSSHIKAMFTMKML